MKNRNQAYNRHQRNRVIKRKVRILRDTTYDFDDEFLVPGRLAKGKVHCSCRMCRYEQFHHIPKAKVAARWSIMLLDIDEI